MRTKIVFLYTLLMILMSSISFAQVTTTVTTRETYCNPEFIRRFPGGAINGLVDLNEEYTRLNSGAVLPPGGEWSDPISNLILVPETGVLKLWEIRNSNVVVPDPIPMDSSLTAEDENPFYVYNYTVKDGVDTTIYRFEVTVGAYAGRARNFTTVCAVFDNSVEKCGYFVKDFDLNDQLTARIFVGGVGEFVGMRPHLNGYWKYKGVDKSIATGTPDAVDQDIDAFNLALKNSPLFTGQVNFESSVGGDPLEEVNLIFEYTVDDGELCVGSAGDNREVTVVVRRNLYAGSANKIIITQDEIEAPGNKWDGDIYLRDNDYLVGEDSNGRWVFEGVQEVEIDGVLVEVPIEPTGEITGPDDDEVNIKRYYDTVLATIPDRRFAPIKIKYSYVVDARELNCVSDQSDIEFIIVQSLRDINQIDISTKDNAFCMSPTTVDDIDLNEFIEFTLGSKYSLDDEDVDVSWELISDDKLIQENGIFNKETGVIGLGAYTNLAQFDNVPEGDYKFRFTVRVPDEFSAFNSVEFDDTGCGIKTTSTNLSNKEFVKTVDIDISLDRFQGTGVDKATGEFCLDRVITNPSLTSLLRSSQESVDGSPIETRVDTGGIWYDISDKDDPKEIVGGIIDVGGFNVDDISKNFKYEYRTSNGKCESRSEFDLTVFNSFENGTPLIAPGITNSEDEIIEVKDFEVDFCIDDSFTNRFTMLRNLGLNPTEDGLWYLLQLNGRYLSQPRFAGVNPGGVAFGVGVTKFYIYEDKNNARCDQSYIRVKVNILDRVNAGAGVEENKFYPAQSICRDNAGIDGFIDLRDALLDAEQEFIDELGESEKLNYISANKDGVFEFKQKPGQPTLDLVSLNEIQNPGADPDAEESKDKFYINFDNVRTDQNFENFDFEYTVSNGACDDDSATLPIRLIIVDKPQLQNDPNDPTDIEEFCRNEAVTFDDIRVLHGDSLNFYSSENAENTVEREEFLRQVQLGLIEEEEEEEEAITVLISTGTFWVDQSVTTGDVNCISNRSSVSYIVNEIGSSVDCGDGIGEPGTDGYERGTPGSLSLGRISKIFPDFVMNIYNKHGVLMLRVTEDDIVREGGFEYLKLADQSKYNFPEGIYYYILNPNDLSVKPLQNTFYLKR